MKLVMAVVHDHDALRSLDLLTKKGFSAIMIARTSNILRNGLSALLSSVEEERMMELFNLIEQSCRNHMQITSVKAKNINIGEDGVSIPYPAEILVGTANVFVFEA